MGRRKINQEEKKEKISITISNKNLNRFKYLEITNKSKLIGCLLEKYFNKNYV